MTVEAGGSCGWRLRLWRLEETVAGGCDWRLWLEAVAVEAVAEAVEAVAGGCGWSLWLEAVAGGCG